MVPLRRLTTIVMPHRGPRASLRVKKIAPSPKRNDNNSSAICDFRKMSDIQMLKYGLTQKLSKNNGWLRDLLQREGIMDASKQSKKELCWRYYKSQLLYIEALQEAKEDDEFDPRRSDHITGKDGRFIKRKQGADKPQNPLTVTYLCYAFGVPYASFKRWKNDAFVTKKQVPENKGKSIVTDKKWAASIGNPRRMYVLHSLENWLHKHPYQKHNAQAKKV